MLALNTKLRLTLAIVGTLLFLAQPAMGQQPPSSRFQPAQPPAFQASPPSVHIPSQPEQYRLQTDQNRSPQPAPKFNFSDAATSASAATNRNGAQTPKVLRHANFQNNGHQDPVVPAILHQKPGADSTTQESRQASSEPPRPPSQMTPSNRLTNAPAFSPAPQNPRLKTPDDFESVVRMSQINSPVQTPRDIANDPKIALEMANLQAAAKSKTLGHDQSRSGQFVTNPSINSTTSEFTKRKRPAAVSLPSSPLDLTHSPKLVATQTTDVKPQKQVTPANENRTTLIPPAKDSRIRKASAQNVDSTASISLAAPAIQVETYGPASIGIDKPATYKIIVRNNSSDTAQRILVGINIPHWVDLDKVDLTTGVKEVSDGKNQARLVWNIDHIAGNASQTMTITAVPRKAEMFDLGIEWTLVPRVGKSSIRVTQPRLEMNISGPRDVLFGEKAVYHVTIRNPGTGTAENVFVMLPEALGGARHKFGDIQAGSEENCQVVLEARTAGELDLNVTATADGNLATSAEKSLTVRRAKLNIALTGPALKYSGSTAQYTVTITNAGDATATELNSGVAFPAGVKYIGGIESFKQVDGGIQWSVGSLDPGQSRSYQLNCQLDTAGELQLEVGARGKGDLAASSACLTMVETVADLVLSVSDPKGPLPTGENVDFNITVRNRGTKSAKGVNLVMQFSEGIEPQSATGLGHRIVPGQVLFSPVDQIEPGQEVSFSVSAQAIKQGTHVFRAQLTCNDDAEVHEMAEGTTRFYGKTIQPKTTTLPSTAKAVESSNDFNGFK